MAVTKMAPSPQVCVAYAVFLGIAGSVWHFVANGSFSAITTLAEIFQCGALVILAMQVFSNGSTAGISARALGLEAASLSCKLSSTIWLEGYLPTDASGDWLYQVVGTCSLLVALWLLREVLVTRRSSYQVDADSAPWGLQVVLVAIVLAALLHGDMNNFPLFDALWMAGLFLGVVAVLPQLWLMSRMGGMVDSLTSHYIAMMAASRILSGVFMWHARFDITCDPWVQDFNHASWAILSAHLLHLFLLGDFALIYVRTMVTQGLQARLDLEGVVHCV